MGWSPTVAVNEPLTIGTEFDAVSGRVRVVAELSRDEYFEDLESRREWTRKHGLTARAGTYMADTKEFKPGREVPADCRYFYRIEPV